MKAYLKWLYPAITFLLSIKASVLGGRAMWIDEFTRISSQKNYTIDQLLACQNLKDFDSQSPIGYILWRPVQSLLGIEWGGCLLSALGAAVIVAMALRFIRRWKGSDPHWSVGVLLALSPLAVYYGGELWFYAPWGAVFAVALYQIVRWHDETDFEGTLCRAALLFVFGSLFLALHFAGIFIWAVVSAVAVCFCLKRFGMGRATRLSLILGLPIAVNLSLYLSAQHAATHLGSQTLQLSKTGQALSWVLKYVWSHFPCLTGASWLGVALFVVGMVWVVRRKGWSEALILFASVFAIFVYMAYSALREYYMPAVRYWMFGAAPTLAVVGIGCEWLLKRRRAAVLVIGMATGLNALGAASVVQMGGRAHPFVWFVRRIAERGVPGPVLFPNHYETRMFNGRYNLPQGFTTAIPCYWELGEACRTAGMRAITELTPLAPIVTMSDDRLLWLDGDRYAEGDVYADKNTVLQRFALAASLMPEPYILASPKMQVVIPSREWARERADRKSTPCFIPGKGWDFIQLRPKAQTEPFVPAMLLHAGKTASFECSLPSGWTKNHSTVRVACVIGSQGNGSVLVNGIRHPVGGAPRPIVIDCGAHKDGETFDVNFTAEEKDVFLLSLKCVK